LVISRILSNFLGSVDPCGPSLTRKIRTIETFIEKKLELDEAYKNLLFAEN